MTTPPFAQLCDNQLHDLQVYGVGSQAVNYLNQQKRRRLYTPCYALSYFARVVPVWTLFGFMHQVAKRSTKLFPVCHRHLLVFGGGIPDTNTFFSKVAVLDTHTWTWSYPPLQVCLPCISCECFPALQTQKKKRYICCSQCQAD